MDKVDVKESNYYVSLRIWKEMNEATRYKAGIWMIKRLFNE